MSDTQQQQLQQDEEGQDLNEEDANAQEEEEFPTEIEVWMGESEQV